MQWPNNYFEYMTCITITVGKIAPSSGTLEEQCLTRKNYLCLQTENCNGPFYCNTSQQYKQAARKVLPGFDLYSSDFQDQTKALKTAGALVLFFIITESQWQRKLCWWGLQVRILRFHHFLLKMSFHQLPGLGTSTPTSIFLPLLKCL